jgi:hypothetical protein
MLRKYEFDLGASFFAVIQVERASDMGETKKGCSPFTVSQYCNIANVITTQSSILCIDY